MKPSIWTKTSNARRTVSAIVVGTVLAIPLHAGADINAIKDRPKSSFDAKWPGMDDSNPLASVSDATSIPKADRNLRCWQSGQLIVYDANWNYLPKTSTGRSISFGSDGKITKRLIIEGETTCLFIDLRGIN